MIKWIVIAVVVVLALLMLLIIIAGARAPARHVARVSLVSKKKPSEIWPLLENMEAWPSWNPSIKKMERLPDKDGHAVWGLTWQGDVMPSEVLEMTPPSRLVTRIADDKLPFGGTWSWEIVEHDEGSRVTITEDGFINNAFFRGVSSLFLGYTGTQNAYLTALARKLGDESKPQIESVTFPAT